MRPDWALLTDGADRIRLCWLGHATCFVQMAGGLRLLTDPVFSARASPVQFAGPRRYVDAPCGAAEVPTPHLVLISHDHYDHLDYNSIVALEAAAASAATQPTYVFGLGTRAWFVANFPAIPAGRLVELDWWQQHSLPGGVQVEFVPAQHWATRTYLDCNQRLWGGFVVTDQAGRKFYYTGDTGFSQELFAEIGARHSPVDVAAIPIGAYEPRWFMAPQHVGPEEAYAIHGLLGSRLSVGVHWGTFLLTDEPIDEPRRLLERICAEHADGQPFRTLRHGESI